MGREIKFQILWVKNNIDFTKSIEKHYTTLERLTDGTDQFPYCDVEIIAKRQYTGLKDKNGVEIYEGDVIYAFGAPLEVKWIVDGWFADCEVTGICESGQEWENSCEVIGNIHENPELLK